MADSDEVTFVPCMGNWDVLYYSEGGRFTTTPVIAWVITADSDGFVHTYPITLDAWALEDSRPVCGPDGDVTCGDLEHWDNVWMWLDDMRKRETADPRALPPGPGVRIGDSKKAPVLALDNFRHRFQQPLPHGDD